MGCVCSDMAAEDRFEEPLNEESVVKQYSWDKRESIRQRENVVTSLQNLCDTTTTRVAGTSSGHQIVIQKCQNSGIHIFDCLTSVLVEDCSDCVMLLGPTETSVIFTNCKNCKALVACGQMTLKNCSNMAVYLLCASQPALETCDHIHFCCFEFFYPQLEDHLHRAQLSVYNNFWNCVTDTSAIDEDSPNFTVSTKRPDIRASFGLPEEWQQNGVVLGSDHTIVPYMPCHQTNPSDKSCLVMFFNDGLSHDRARNFIKLMNNNHPECALVQGREMLLKEDESSEIFNSDKYATAIKQGPVIGLEYQGESCRHFCQEILVTVSKGSTGLVFISDAKQLCLKQVEAFRRIADVKFANMKSPDANKKKAVSC